MGTGGSAESVPTYKSPEVVSRESIQAQLDALPQIVEAQKQYSPELLQMELDNLREFGGQFSQEQIDLEREFGPELARATRDSIGELAPERIAGQDVLYDYLTQENLLTSSEEEQFRADHRAATSVRGLGESGEAALDELRQLTGLRQSLKSQRLNIALSSAGLVPVTGQQTTQTPNTSVGQLVQNVTPSDFFGLSANRATAGASQFNTLASARTAERGQNAGMWSAGMNMVGTAIGSSVEYKEQITDNEIDSIQVVKDTNVKNFKYKEGMEMLDKRYIGVIAEEAPEILTNKERNVFDMYSAIGVLLDVNKKLIARIEKLEEVR